MSRKINVYIAGPMRGIKYFNFPAFDAARDKLRALGYDPISPADLDRQSGFDPMTLPDDYDWRDLNKINFSLHDAVDRDVAAIKTCGAIYMLAGWEQSKGAQAEKAIAEWLGIPANFEQDIDKTGLTYVHPSMPAVRAYTAAEDVLEEALRITRGDRQASYGPPDADFQRTAAMWDVLLAPCIKTDDEGSVHLKIEPRFVAMCMIALKMSRETHQRKRDNWVDIAGYSRCGSLCAN